MWEGEKVAGRKLEGGVLVMSLCREKGQKSVWHSSEVLAEKRGQNLYVNFTLMAAMVLFKIILIEFLCLLMIANDLIWFL